LVRGRYTGRSQALCTLKEGTTDEKAQSQKKESENEHRESSY